MTLFLQVVGVLVGVGASAVTFRIPQSGIIWAGLTGLIGWEVYTAFAIFGFQPIACTLLGAFTIAITSELLARSLKMPSTVFVAPGILPLVPGMRTYDAMLALVTENHELATLNSLQALLAAGGIAVGLLMGSAVAKAWIHPYHPHKLKPRPEDNAGQRAKQNTLLEKKRKRRGPKAHHHAATALPSSECSTVGQASSLASASATPTATAQGGNTTQSGATHVDTPQINTPQTGANQANTTQSDATHVDTPQVDTTQTGTNQTNTTQVDDSAIVAPDQDSAHSDNTTAPPKRTPYKRRDQHAELTTASTQNSPRATRRTNRRRTRPR